MLWLCMRFAQLERARFAVTLGVDLPAPPRDLGTAAGVWSRVKRPFTLPSARRELGYALLRFPLALAETIIVIAMWSLAVALLGVPLFSYLLFDVDWHIGLAGPAPGVMAAESALGLILLLMAPHLTRGLAIADTAVARFLIGPGGSEDMTVRIGELERSRARVVDAADSERRRIERDLHDGAQQRLVSLAMNLGRAKARFAGDPEGAKAILDQAHTEALGALAELRNLVRGVHPPVLTDRGLDAAISGLAALSPVPVSVDVEIGVRPSASIEAIAYFVVAEALTNVAKHAHATHADVAIVRRGTVLHVVISDDGTGGADPQGQGLAGLADRAAGIDGRLYVRSPAGGPTVIEVHLPCGS
jgi:signal transduction histidine kinase